MNWIIQQYQASAQVGGRQEASSLLVECRERFTQAVTLINRVLSGATAGRYAHPPDDGQRLVGALERAYTPKVVELLRAQNQQAFDAVCAPAPAAQVDVARELDLLSNFEWVESMTVDDHHLTVRTKDVVIEHDGERYNLGQFKLLLARNKLTGVLEGARHPTQLLTIIGPRVYEADGQYYHPHIPHVDRDDPCYGEAEAPFCNAIKAGLISDAMLVIWSFLNTYNNSSPMCNIEAFAAANERSVLSDGGRACPGCGLGVRLAADTVRVGEVTYHSGCTFSRSTTGERVGNDQRYDCPSCGRFMSIDDKRDDGQRLYCYGCVNQVDAERAMGNAGDWQCFNCLAEHPSTVAPAYTRRGVKVCNTCTTTENGQVKVRYTVHWNARQLLGNIMSVSTLFERLRPASYTVERFARAAVDNIAVDMAPGVDRAVVSAVCSCGAVTSADPLRTCVYRPGVSVCQSCDPEKLGVSPEAKNCSETLNYIHDSIATLVPSTVLVDIGRLRRPGVHGVLAVLRSWPNQRVGDVLCNLRRAHLGLISKPAADAPTSIWIAWVNRLAQVPGQRFNPLIEL